MPSAEPRPRRGALSVLIAGALVATVVAPTAHADVVRLTTTRSDDGQASTTTVSAFPATGTSGAGVPVTGLPDAIEALTRSPDGGRVAYVGTRGIGDDASRVAGVLSAAGGPTRPFLGPDGAALVAGRDADELTQQEAPGRWISWGPTGSTLVLHAFDPGGIDPWFARPTARTCDAVSGRCGAARHEDAIDLPGGGTVRVAASLTARPGAGRSTDPDFSGALTRRRARARLGRRFTVRVRVTGRPAATRAFSVAGRLRGGAPAYDRSYPSSAGVLVRLASVRFDPADRALDGLSATTGPAVVVRPDGTMRRVAALPYDVVGTLPDGRWILAGGAEEEDLPRPPAGEPLRTLDADGRVAVLRWGTRPITPIWATHAAGFPDSRATVSEVLRAGVDPRTGLLVLAVRASQDGLFGELSNDALLTVPLDGSGPPRARAAGPGTGRAPVTTTDLLE